MIIERNVRNLPGLSYYINSFTFNSFLHWSKLIIFGFGIEREDEQCEESDDIEICEPPSPWFMQSFENSSGHSVIILLQPRHLRTFRRVGMSDSGISDIILLQPRQFRRFRRVGMSDSGHSVVFRFWIWRMNFSDFRYSIISSLPWPSMHLLICTCLLRMLNETGNFHLHTMQNVLSWISSRGRLVGSCGVSALEWVLGWRWVDWGVLGCLPVWLIFFSSSIVGNTS